MLSVIPSVRPSVRSSVIILFTLNILCQNNFIEFHQILYMHWYWQDLAWDCYTSFFLHLYLSYDPWSMPKLRSGSISWEQMDRISPNFIYAFIFTRSSMELLHIIFPTFAPLIYAKISFPLDILRTNWQNSPNFIMHSYWQDLAWDCYASFFLHLHQSYCPLFTPKFRFRSISWEQNDRISPNFIYAFILTRSSVGVLHIIFLHLYQSYCP